MAQAVSAVTASAGKESWSLAQGRLPQSHSPPHPRGIPGSFSGSVSPALPKGALKMNSPLFGVWWG